MDLTLNNPCWKLMKAPWKKEAAAPVQQAA
jgi:hypothetical protein